MKFVWLKNLFRENVYFITPRNIFIFLFKDYSAVPSQADTTVMELADEEKMYGKSFGRLK